MNDIFDMKYLVRLILLVTFLGAATLRAALPPPETFHTSPRASVLITGGSMMNGNHFADSTLPAMREHFAGVKRLALVLHASPPAERDAMEKRMQAAFAHIGVPQVESLHHLDAAAALQLLRTADAIWVGGGETFALLAELHRTGQLEVIRARALAGVPFGGASAGANVAGLLIGTTNDFPVAEVPTRNALGLIPAVINPHHPAPEVKGEFDGRGGKINIYLKFNPDHAVIGMANASVVRLHGGKLTLVSGRAWLYRAGGVRELKAGDEMPELMPAEGRKR